MLKLTKKKIIIIILVVVLVIIIAIPSGYVLAMNGSTYDCSFQYAKADNLVNDIAKKHIYYNAADRTVEVELNQDMINSLIKDNLSSMKLDLPKNVTIREVLFNTKDQRLYINAKYGSLNVPISMKINVKILDSGLELSPSDVKLGQKNAPGFIKNQILSGGMKFSVNFADIGVPQVFAVKDLKFGSGNLKAVIQLDSKKIADLAVGYRADVLKGIDGFKSSLPEPVAIFVSKLMDTGIMSEEKMREYVEKALGNEELINSARFFAMASDLSKYSKSVETAQKTVMDWVAPLTSIKLDGTVDEIANSLLSNEQLKERLSWFLPVDTINEYQKTASDYYGMYKDYYGMYEQFLASVDEAVGSIPTGDINKYVRDATDGTNMLEDGRKYLNSKLALVTDKDIRDFVYSFEGNKADAEDFIVNLRDAKATADDFLRLSYKKEISQFNSAIKDQQQFTFSVIDQLKSKQYEQAVNTLYGTGLTSQKAQAFIDRYSPEWDFSFVDELADMKF